MEIILLPLFIIFGIALSSIVDDLACGRHYKSDAEKTPEDWEEERRREDEIHSITWE